MKKNRVMYTSLMMITMEILYWVFCIVSRGTYLTNYFVHDVTDTSMDYYNVLMAVQGNDPYSSSIVAAYPAMCFAIMRLLYHICPSSLQLADGKFLRVYEPATIGYILFQLLILVSIWEMLRSIKFDDRKTSIFFSASILFSGIMLFTLERGNLVILAFAFLMFFFLFYDSDRKIIRYAAYFSLAMAASIKIYPAIFGMLVLCKKRYRETLDLVIMGIVVFCFPFFTINGIKSLEQFISGVSNSADMALQSCLGVGSNYSFRNLYNIFSKLFGKGTMTSSTFLLIIPVCWGAFVFFKTKKYWQKVFVLSMMCIWIPGYSFTYVLLFLIIPFIAFLREMSSNKTLANYYSISFIMIFVPLALPSIESYSDTNRFPLTWSTLIVNCVILGMAITILIDTIYGMRYKNVK